MGLYLKSVDRWKQLRQDACCHLYK